MATGINKRQSNPKLTQANQTNFPVFSPGRSPEQSHHPNSQLGGRNTALCRRALIEILARSHDALLQVRGPKVLHTVRLDPDPAHHRRPSVAVVHRSRSQVSIECSVRPPAVKLTQPLRGAGAVVDVHQGI